MVKKASFLSIRLLSFPCLFLCALPSQAQSNSNKQFQWQFANSAISFSLPTCATLPIVVKSFDPTTNLTHGVPPYYMISLAVGGTPQTTFIGTDDNNLSWTVTHAVGTTLVLSVVDSTGGAGGIPPQTFNVMPGQSTQCVVLPSSAPPFTVTANVTTDLTTCQPWGLTVKGGVPPYNVTLVELNSPVVTNITMPNGLDRFTYIDRADPNAKLIAAVSDFTGRWATGTPLVNTIGPAVTDNSCPGLVSSSGNATLIQQQIDAANTSIQAAKRRHTTVVAVVVTLLLLLIVGILCVVFFRRRERQKEYEAELAEAKPTQFVETPKEVTMLSINNYLERNRNQTQPTSRKAAILAEMRGIQTSGNGEASRDRSSSLQGSPNSTTGLLSSVNSSLDRNGSATVVVGSRSASRASNSGFARFPTTSIRQSAKLLESNAFTTRSPESESPESGLPVGAEVFQHQDAGVARVSLPPPYADRLRRSQPPHA